jgi:hypothetical protein
MPAMHLALITATERRRDNKEIAGDGAMLP